CLTRLKFRRLPRKARSSIQSISAASRIANAKRVTRRTSRSSIPSIWATSRCFNVSSVTRDSLQILRDNISLADSLAVAEPLPQVTDLTRVIGVVKSKERYGAAEL